jgi:hypothetical protein
MSEIKVNKITPRTNCGTVTVGDSGDSVSVSSGVAVTVNGDLKSNNLKATDGGVIISQCGTTITLGASGDTVALASGASQTGFGSPGQLVDWQTGDIKTATFTAADGKGYFCNTSGGAFTVNLPAGSAGAVIAVVDYTNTFQTNNLTISPNGSEKIGGSANDSTLSTEGESVTLLYVDSNEGWKNVSGTTENVIGQAPFPTATGGTITTSGDYKIHTFTSPGTFTVTEPGSCITGNGKADYMVIAGGGSGGTSYGGGGGAGGYRESYTPAVSGPYTASPLANPDAALTLVAQGYPVTVGGGGSNPANGSTSTFSTISSAGGGAGRSASTGAGSDGGNGGGGVGTGAGGSGNTPPVSPPQGNNGSGGGNPMFGGGGGGAGGAGGSTGGYGGAPGGVGTTTSISASPVARAGGGGGGNGPGQFNPPGTGGTGGGGTATSGGTGCGTANTGGGGGSGNLGFGGSSGGSGVVIIRYKFQ